MSDYVEDIECGEHTIRIFRDEYPENPYEAWDFFSTYASVYERDNIGKGWDEIADDWDEDENSENYGERIYPKDLDGLRKFCSEYHGVIAIPYRIDYYGGIDQRDASDADGFVFATPDMIKKEYGDLSPKSIQSAISLLQAEFETFKAWADGDVYGHKVVLTADLEEDDDPDEVEDGMCAGFYGNDYWDNGIYDSVSSIVGAENLPQRPGRLKNFMPKVNIANGCASCAVYLMKILRQSAEKAAKKSMAFQPA